jgi:hypothetical protein
MGSDHDNVPIPLRIASELGSFKALAAGIRTDLRHLTNNPVCRRFGRMPGPPPPTYTDFWTAASAIPAQGRHPRRPGEGN